MRANHSEKNSPLFYSFTLHGPLMMLVVGILLHDS
jgi:hypothetical protein